MKRKTELFLLTFLIGFCLDVYGQQQTSLTITITPRQAINEGAKWRIVANPAIDDGSWRESGDTKYQLPTTAPIRVEFKPVETGGGCNISPNAMTITVNGSINRNAIYSGSDTTKCK